MPLQKSPFVLEIISSRIDHLLAHGGRRLLVVRELHCKGSPTLRAGAEVCCITEHLRKRRNRVDDLRPVAHFHAGDMTAARGQVAQNVAEIVLRHEHFNLHHRFEQHGARLRERFLDRERARDLERDLRGIDLVIGTVDERCADVHHRIAAKRAGFQRVADTAFDRRDVLLRDHAADDLIDELKAGTRLHGLEGHLAVAELAMAAGLPDITSFDRDGLCDGLLVCDLRTADRGFHMELADQSVE